VRTHISVRRPTNRREVGVGEKRGHKEVQRKPREANIGTRVPLELYLENMYLGQTLGSLGNA